MRICKSTRQGKKYVAIFSDGVKTHFGGAGCGDFTVYSARDPRIARQKRRAYIARHGATESWKDPRTPATLSRFILWEKPTIAEALLAYRRKFKGRV